MELTTVYVLAVILLATLIRSAFGFGEALVAVPLLALRIPIEVAVPLAVLVSITVAALVLLQDWRAVHLGPAGWLVLWTSLGIPVGLLLLIAVQAHIVKCLLGCVIVAFSGWSLLRRVPFHLSRDRPLWLMVFGFSAGVLGGAYGMNGPPLVIYGTARRWSAAHFRSTLQAYFLPASIIAMAGYWLAGLWAPAVTRYYLLSLPAIVVATLGGRFIHRRLRPAVFFRFVHAGLLAIGVALIVQALHQRRVPARPNGVRHILRRATAATVCARTADCASSPPAVLAARGDDSIIPQMTAPPCETNTMGYALALQAAARRFPAEYSRRGRVCLTSSLCS